MTNLIALYFYIEERYEKEWKYSCERFSNNKKPEFTDVELLSVYCYVMMDERRFKLKEIHRFAEKYLLSWFPKLPSYQAFNNRVNRLGEVFRLGSGIDKRLYTRRSRAESVFGRFFTRYYLFGKKKKQVSKTDKRKGILFYQRICGITV